MSLYRRLRNHVVGPYERWLNDQRVEKALFAICDYPLPTPIRKSALDRELIVSLTSYPKRYGTLGLTLKSLLTQSTAPDRILLWLTPEDRDKLPKSLWALADRVEVITCSDMRSYAKLLPALEAFPNAHIVTADDDLYYPPDWLEGLIETHRAHPDAIVCWRAHLARFARDGSIARYNDWDYETDLQIASRPREALFPTGVGGVLYPAGCLPAQTLDLARIRTLCSHADDIWFFWMARLAGVPHRRVRGRFDVVNWPDSQEVSLHSSNVADKHNDVQLRAMEQAFGPVAPRSGRAGPADMSYVGTAPVAEASQSLREQPTRSDA